ncbi:MAG: hypothetical protein ABIZ81_10445 [Opitutaceae bacterium]
MLVALRALLQFAALFPGQDANCIADPAGTPVLNQVATRSPAVTSTAVLPFVVQLSGETLR